jgi:hypothetical protein
MRRIIGTTALLAVLGISTSAMAATIEPGTYVCQYYAGQILMSMGDIEINGTSYRGPAYDGNYGPAYEYELTSENYVIWRGPLGGLSSGGNAVGASTYENGVIAVQVITDGGGTLTMLCDR